MSEQRYLLDTVTVSKLSAEQLQSAVVRNQSHIPEEIMYELKDNHNFALLIDLKMEISAKYLEYVRRVLGLLADDDHILDLNNNEGNGDITLLAYAKCKMSEEVGTLFPETWVIVSDDTRLHEVASELNVAVRNTDEFVAILSSSIEKVKA